MWYDGWLVASSLQIIRKILILSDTLLLFGSLQRISSFNSRLLIQSLKSLLSSLSGGSPLELGGFRDSALFVTQLID